MAWLVATPLAYALIFFLRTYPLITHWDTRLFGKLAVDQYAQLWLHWWVKFSLLDLHQGDFLFTDYMNYPRGVDITADYICFFHALLSVPLQLIFGLVGAVNTLYLLVHVFSSMGIFLLARYLTRSNLAAFIAGLLVIHNPYFAIISNLNTELFDLGWMALFLLFLVKSTRTEGWRQPLYAALFLALASLASMEHGLYLYLFMGFHATAFVVRHRRWQPIKPFLQRMAVIAALFAVLISPFAVVAISQFSQNVPQSMDWLGRAEISELQQPVKGKLFVPSHRPRVDTKITVGKLTALSVGFLLIGLSLGLLRGPRELWYWLAAGLCFWCLSAGHEVLIYSGAHGTGHVQLEKFDNYPFILLLEHFPLFWRFSWPNRMVVVVLIALSVLFAHGLAQGIQLVRQRDRGLRRPLAVPLLLASVLLVIFLLPWERHRLPSLDRQSLAHQMPSSLPTSSFKVEPVYQDLANEPGDFAVMVLPLFAWTGPVVMGNLRYAQQTVFRKRLVNCHFPPFKVKYSRETQIQKMDRILYDILLDGGPLPSMPAGVMAYLRKEKIKYVITSERIPVVYSRQNERQILTHWFGAPRLYGGRYRRYQVY